MAKLGIISGTGWDRALKPCSALINRPFPVESYGSDILHLISYQKTKVGLMDSQNDQIGDYLGNGLR